MGPRPSKKIGSSEPWYIGGLWELLLYWYNKIAKNTKNLGDNKYTLGDFGFLLTRYISISYFQGLTKIYLSLVVP